MLYHTPMKGVKAMKSKLIPSVYGRVRVVENWNGHKRLWVKQTNVKSYVLSTSERVTLDSMIEVAGEYHFATLKSLHEALNH